MPNHISLPISLMLLVAASAAPTTVLGQDVPYVPQRIGTKSQIPADRTGITITVTVSAPYDDKTPMDEQVTTAQRQMYKLAAKQCDVALETIADACELVGFNSNINSQQRQPQSPILANTATLTLSVKFKTRP